MTFNEGARTIEAEFAPRFGERYDACAQADAALSALGEEYEARYEALQRAVETEEGGAR